MILIRASCVIRESFSRSCFMKIFLTAILVVISATAFSQSVKVMTYNIRYDTEKDSVNRWSNRKEKVAALIQKYDPTLSDCRKRCIIRSWIF